MTQEELNNLKSEIDQKIKSKQEELDSKIKQINDSLDGEGEVGEKLKNQFTSLNSQIESLQGQLNELDGKLGKAQNQLQKEKPQAEQIKEILQNDERVKAFLNGESGRVKTDLSAVLSKAMTVGTDFTGDVIRPDRRPGVIVPPQQRVHVRDLYSSILPTDSDTVEKPVEQSRTDNAGNVAENSNKPESSATFGVSSYRVETVAHLYRMTRRMFEDTNFIANWIRTQGLQGILDQEDQQLITGSGSTPELQGLQTAGVGFSLGVSSVQNPTKYDLLSRAITQLRNSFYRPNVILVSPNDYDNIIHEKDANNNYVFGAPIGTTQGQLNVKGIPIVDHEIIADDNFIVADLNTAAELYDRQQVQVQFSEEDRDNFQKNLITARIEERVANAVWQSNGIVADQFSTNLP